MKYSSVIWVLAAVLPLADLQLELSSYPPFEGSYCPGNLTFTCRGVRVSFGLSWYLNNTVLYTYVFLNNGVEQFPKTGYMTNGITIVIADISFSPPATTLNITSTLMGTVSHLQDSTISCGVASFTSSSFLVRLQDPPSRPLISLCTLSDQYHLVLQWYTQSNNDVLEVDYIKNMQCSDINVVNSRESLSCNSLQENNSYNFNVTSLNCGRQNGPHQFILDIAKNISTAFKTTATYLPDDYIFIEIGWNYRDMMDSILVHSVHDPSEDIFSTTMIEIIIVALPAENIIINETFSQDSDRFCNDNLECSILHGFMNKNDSSYMIKVSGFRNNLSSYCNVPLNHYIEMIPGSLSTLINFTLLPINNSIYALCSSSISLSICSLQYTSNPRYKDLSTVTISLNVPYRLPLQLNPGESYYFHLTVNLSENFRIKTAYGPLSIHMLINKETLLYDKITTIELNTQLLDGYKMEAAVIVILVVSFIGLLIALLVIALLCHQVKTLQKLDRSQVPNTNNMIELMQETPLEKRDCEIIYDEPNLRRSVYAEVKNDAYNRYEPHSADKVISVDSVHNTTYDIPT